MAYLWFWLSMRLYYLGVMVARRRNPAEPTKEREKFNSLVYRAIYNQAYRDVS